MVSLSIGWKSPTTHATQSQNNNYGIWGVECHFAGDKKSNLVRGVPTTMMPWALPHLATSAGRKDELQTIVINNNSAWLDWIFFDSFFIYFFSLLGRVTGILNQKTKQKYQWTLTGTTPSRPDRALFSSNSKQKFNLVFCSHGLFTCILCHLHGNVWSYASVLPLKYFLA